MPEVPRVRTDAELLSILTEQQGWGILRKKWRTILNRAIKNIRKPDSGISERDYHSGYLNGVLDVMQVAKAGVTQQELAQLFEDAESYVD